MNTPFPRKPALAAADALAAMCGTVTMATPVAAETSATGTVTHAGTGYALFTWSGTTNAMAVLANANTWAHLATQWKFTRETNSRYYTIHRVRDASGGCLTYEKATDSRWGTMTAWSRTCNNTYDQDWRVVSAGSGTVTISPRNASDQYLKSSPYTVETNALGVMVGSLESDHDLSARWKVPSGVGDGLTP